MKSKPLPPKKVLDRLLDYDPQTGVLTWKQRPKELFNATPGRTRANTAANWNSCHVGKEASGVHPRTGYRHLHIHDQAHSAHRVIWKMMTGKDPVSDLDHIDGNRSNNRWHNLREVTSQGNNRNRQRSTRNTSGAIGVRWETARAKWYVSIVVDRVTIFLGRFEGLAEAIEARKAADLKYNFHQNHGRDPVPR